MQEDFQLMKELFGGCLPTDAGKVDANSRIQDRCRHDLLLFAKTYLSHAFPSDWSSFHLDSARLLDSIIFETVDTETKDVIACPRGHAKSTFFSFLEVIHACCYGTKKFVLLISATGVVAKQFISDIRNELEFNEKLKRDFGLDKDPNLWNATDFRVHSTNGVTYVCGRGAGAQVRGLKANGGTRPDLIIVDDLEDEENVSSPAQAEALEKWFNSDLLPCGAAGRTSFIIVGTILAYNSLLFKLLNEPKYSIWRRRTYQAVISYAEDTEKWDKWEELMLDAGDPHAYDTAYQYYLDNKEDMLRGAKVLWESQRKDMYLYLMCVKLANEDSFNSEFQNQPLDEKSRTFKTEWIEENGYDSLPELKAVSAAIDPSMGKTRKADTSAIIFIGQGKDDGRFYILDASVAVRKPDELIHDVEELIKKWYRYDPLITVETNVFQNFFATTIKEKFEKNNIYVRWNDVVHLPGDSKAQRILSLVPYIKNGLIKFPRNGARVLKEQLKMFPRATSHDDGPDALEMALRPLLYAGKSSFSFGGIKTNNSEDRGFLNVLQEFLGKGR